MKKINFRQQLERYIRVLKLLKTPTREELIASVKIAGGGILLVGFVGFVLWFILVHVLGII